MSAGVALIVIILLFLLMGFPLNLIVAILYAIGFYLFYDKNDEGKQKILDEYRFKMRYASPEERRRLASERSDRLIAYQKEHPVKKDPVKEKLRIIFTVALLLSVVIGIIVLIYVLFFY